MVKTLLGSTFVEWFSDCIWYNRIPCLVETILTIIISMVHCLQLVLHFRAIKIQQQLVDLEKSTDTVPTSRSKADRSISTSNASSMNHSKDPLISGGLTVLVIAFTLLYHIHCCIGLFPILYEWIGPVKHCSIWPNLLAAFWHSVKCSIYNLYLFRIKAVFRGSAYMYSNRIMYALAAMINTFWLFAIIGDFTEIYGVWEYAPSEDSFWC